MTSFLRSLLGLWVCGALVACPDANVADDTVVAETSDGSETHADTATDAEVDTAADTLPPQDGVVRLLLRDPAVPIADNALSGSVSFQVPTNAVSVTLSVQGTSDATYALQRWQDPNAILVPDDWMDPPIDENDPRRFNGGSVCVTCSNRIFVSPGNFAGLAPNNPGVSLSDGTHEIRIFAVRPQAVMADADVPPMCGDGVCSFSERFAVCPQDACCPRQDCLPRPATGDVRVEAYAKVTPDGTLPATGVLDLNLHFTGAQGWTAASADQNEGLQDVLAGLSTLYAQVGIAVGEITYRDIGEAFQVIESVQGTDSDLMTLFQQSEGNPENALNLFFVDELQIEQDTGFAYLLGISGGIPGPPLVQGGLRSGVAIAVKPLNGVPVGIDTITAHETAHFLGVFHTIDSTPLAGRAPDALSDTIIEDDSTYLMSTSARGLTLTPQQGVVMRSNPFVRHPWLDDD